jgi:predicted RNase H-like HicB family nuclease
MKELIFLVEDAPEGGYTARALGEAIFTEAETVDELRENIRDAVRTHFENGSEPKVVRMHFVRDEILQV